MNQPVSSKRSKDKQNGWTSRVWPMSLIERWRSSNRREQVEDALKYLLDMQWEGQAVSLGSLSAHLELSDRTALKLVNRMTAQGLLESGENGLLLTPEGERWAMQTVRAHRLWERYLADEARMPLSRIHKEAHRREHRLSEHELDELDAHLGFPVRDPHGDPIPTRGGKVRPSPGKPLTSWPENLPGRVVHIEDEPPIAYAQILAEGISLNQTLRVVQATPERLVLSDGENEYRLAPAVAANVFLDPIAHPAKATDRIPLTRLKDRQRAEIIALDEACQGFTRRRFLDLGLTPGTAIYPELLNAFGDPRAYRVRGTLIALRKDQADQIWVRPTPQTGKQRE
jgi:DtxR family Mn-dependent transcriptional regulator